MVRFYLLDLKQMRNRQSFYTKPVDIKTSLAKNFATSQLRNFATSQLRNFATSQLRNFATSQLRNFAITPFLRKIISYTTHGKYLRAFFYLT